MSTEFHTFEVARTFRARPARVFGAWAASESKRRWFARDNPPEWRTEDWRLAFRPGGSERGIFVRSGAERFVYDATYLQIVPDARLVYSYTMACGERLLSASLSTVVLGAEGHGTRFTYTEQIVLLDGGDTLTARRQGSEWLFDRLAATLDEAEARAGV